MFKWWRTRRVSARGKTHKIDGDFQLLIDRNGSHRSAPHRKNTVTHNHIKPQPLCIPTTHKNLPKKKANKLPSNAANCKPGKDLHSSLKLEQNACCKTRCRTHLQKTALTAANCTDMAAQPEKNKKKKQTVSD
jgi:hypothetical protein